MPKPYICPKNLMQMRERVLINNYRELRKRKTISINELDDLMENVDKLLQNYRDVVKGRESWKAKYELRNNDAKDYAKEITNLQKQVEKLKSQLREFKDVE